MTMRRHVLFLCMIGFSLPGWARETAVLDQWKALRNPDADAIRFAEGKAFLDQNADWPEEKTIRLRTEAAAFLERPDRALMAKWCVDSPPISGRGMFACLRAGAGDAPTRERWLHQGWVQGDFAENEEQQILAEQGKALTLKDHDARAERLIYERKSIPAKRMLSRVTTARVAGFKLRLALMGHDAHARATLAHLPASLANTTGVLFDRTEAALAAGKAPAAVALLAQVPANAPYPELWWPMRQVAIREAISGKHYKTAFTIASHHGELKDEPLSEALWLEGWISFEYLKDAKSAYSYFHQLYTNVTTPVSRARAAYWASRAAAVNGNKEIAHEWMVKAAAYPTAFYGQLAQATLSPDAPLDLPDSPAISKQDREAFEADGRVVAVRALRSERDTQLRDRFLTHLATRMESPGQLALLAQLAREVGGVARGVKIAKLALRKQVVLRDESWPRFELPEKIGVEPPLALAISRQESEFDPHARSAANARGLMQLLPDTARQIAQKNNLRYRESLLEDPTTNLTIGTTYLGKIIKGFDGSYVLGIASYNAGPTTVRGWCSAMGSPPARAEAVVRWIESIPYGETRNYVMRVMENVQIYRALSDPEAPLKIFADLTRATP